MERKAMVNGVFKDFSAWTCVDDEGYGCRGGIAGVRGSLLGLVLMMRKAIADVIFRA